MGESDVDKWRNEKKLRRERKWEMGEEDNRNRENRYEKNSDKVRIVKTSKKLVKERKEK